MRKRESVRADGEVIESVDRRCLGALREPWHEVCEEEPGELARRLQIQYWNDKQRLVTDVFGGLDPDVYESRRKWIRRKRELLHARKT